MRNSFVRSTAIAVLFTTLFAGAGTEKSFAQHSRKSPIVEAVKKTQASIVTVKVEKKNASSSKEVVGTGIVIDERGIVVTNRHVVAGADRVNVRLADGSIVPARVHLEAPNHDLAVLKLTTDKKLTALHFSPGSDLMVGETVIAVGNPYGYTNTVTTGIISALGREITMPGNIVLRNLIQVNASINPGNSGGPLLNVNGELIGINVAIREGAQGIAFALNADTVQEVLSKLLSAGKVANLSHGMLCRINVLPEGQVRQQVVVEEVASKSPAAKAGLKSGDVITRIGDQEVRNHFDVERSLWSCKAGDKIDATVVRDGEITQVALTMTPTTGTTKTAVARAENYRTKNSHTTARPVRTNRVNN